MISCTEFIPSYSELFKYIDHRYGYAAVQAFWTYLFTPDGKGIPLVNFVKEEGIRGAMHYWMGTLKEEASDVTLMLNEKQGWYKMDMHDCPSKGRLLKLKEELGIEPYEHYCDHCDYYRAALNEGGLDWVYDFTGTDHAACQAIVYDPKVFKGVMTVDKDTIIQKYTSSNLEYFHPDFHSNMNMGVEYLGTTYGEDAIYEYLTQYTKEVYQKRIAQVREAGLAAIENMILDTYNKEQAQEAVETVLADDTLMVNVHWCPAVRHLRNTGREVSRWYPLTTSVVMDSLASECGFAFTMGAYDPQTGKTSYSFKKVR